ncbi:MAG: LytTR family transcriptional regulator DNA-binding domain-containing protein [Chitinophagaceae bacterium]|nr:LytTR family transcriptional regulator DNA-binding domain-containing protein [Chitinophagaceae bacterium]
MRAFENHAVDYLLKPFTKQRFDKAISKWLDQYTAAQAAAGAQTASSAQTTSGASTPAANTSVTPDDGPTISSGEKTRQLLDTAAHSPAQTQRIVVKTGGKIKIIPVEDIHYLEASDDYVKIHTHNGAFLKNKTMAYFEQVLDPAHFVRTHRSYILNVQQVTRIDPYEKDSHLCILQSGAAVPVSKAGYVKLKAVLGL